jgi:hypothetical protein
MSRSLKATGASLAILLAAWIVQLAPGSADDAGDAPDATGRTKSGEARDQSRPRSKPRGADAPLAHAILKQVEDSMEEKILKALDKPTNVEWQELALEDCLTFLAEFHGIPVWLDKSSLTDEGVALDQPITLKLSGVRLDSVLNLLLQPVQLEWVIQDEVLKITTQGWCKKHPEVQAHEIQELINAGHAADELIATITACIEPESWSPKEDGYAGISHSGGVLVVRQTQRIHTQIARILADLDDIADREAEDHPKQDKGAVVSVKVYPVGDQPADKVAEALMEFVESKSWKDHGGEGEIRPLQGALVVKQNANVHREIQRFLAQFAPKPQPVVAAAQPAATPASANTSPDPFRVLPPPTRSRRPIGQQPGGGNPLRKNPGPK